jgi:large conductance mechanosensitive channel
VLSGFSHGRETDQHASTQFTTFFLAESMARSSTSFLAQFKDFINKGNVVDLAVAVVMAGAFGKVVDAFVSLVMGSLLEPALKAANVDSIAAWPAGTVLVALINFLVIAFVVFLIVRAIESMRRREEAVAAPDPQAQLASAATRLADALDRRQL